ncbi:Fatty acyl-CoA reductase 2 [Nymphaea thermarum]|nr:Fatty acyl-CoA reductase 2 [Nymphaea thermarum]
MLYKETESSKPIILSSGYLTDFRSNLSSAICFVIFLIIMFSLGHLPFVSSPPTNACVTTKQMTVDSSVVISPLPASTTPHQLPSCAMSKSFFPVKSSEPTSSVSMVDVGKWPSGSKRASVATRAATSTQNKSAEAEEEDDYGLGIVAFLRNKNMLITGTTGFLGKLLIEKILRSQPDVGKLFLLIQGPNQEAVIERLKKEIMNDELFKCLKRIHGSSYEAFMLSKLIPVAGHLEEYSLGMEEKIEKVIEDQVHLIISCAANTRFDERYDVAMNTNTNGAARLVKLARGCRKLPAFLHVSTAYVHGARIGLIKERPFFFGDSLAREEAMATQSEEIPPILDIREEVKMIDDTLEGIEENMATPRMKDLGFKRANVHGWHNVYSFTKAMGEMVIGTMSNDIPTIIVRPSIVGSTIQDPFPGWIQGLRMLDPIMVYYGKGRLNFFTAGGETIADLVPADMVVNAILAAIARHGSLGVAGLNIYHAGTSSTNPLRWDELFEHCYEHYHSFPFIDSQGKAVRVERVKLFDTLAAISSHLSSERNGSLKEVKGMNMMLKKLSMAYAPYTSYKGRFDTANAQKLMKKMSREERMNFTFDVAAIEWRDYIVNVHLHGLRKHVIRGYA